jgi:hypothetical protein
MSLPKKLPLLVTLDKLYNIFLVCSEQSIVILEAHVGHFVPWIINQIGWYRGIEAIKKRFNLSVGHINGRQNTPPEATE